MSTRHESSCALSIFSTVLLIFSHCIRALVRICLMCIYTTKKRKYNFFAFLQRLCGCPSFCHVHCAETNTITRLKIFMQAQPQKLCYYRKADVPSRACHNVSTGSSLHADVKDNFQRPSDEPLFSIEVNFFIQCYILYFRLYSITENLAKGLHC